MSSEMLNSLSISDEQSQLTNNSYINDIITIDQLPAYDVDDYDVFDEKDFKHYIIAVKRIVRSSKEYRQYVNYLRENMNMNECSFLTNVNNKDTFKIKIEIHHHPFCLEDIVLTVFNKRTYHQESLEVEMVAKEVMYIHYFLMVGLIPLSETAHELVHEQKLFIPINRVMGNYEEFIDIYRDFIPDYAMEKYEAIKCQSANYVESDNMAILQQKNIAYSLPGGTSDGVYDLPVLETLEATMNNRVEEIKNNQLPEIEQKKELIQLLTPVED